MVDPGSNKYIKRLRRNFERQHATAPNLLIFDPSKPGDAALAAAGDNRKFWIEELEPLGHTGWATTLAGTRRSREEE
eukprot:5306472-Heterocapsa_arctica.AAC.1